MSDCFDRHSKPISREEWAKLFGDQSYPCVWTFEDEKVTISTVWYRLNPNPGGGPPLIFETMIFFKGEEDHEMNDAVWRWHTEEQAKEGHEIIVKCYRENLDPHEVLRSWEESKRKEAMI